MLKNAFIVVVLLGLLAAVLFYVVPSFDGTAMSVHGWIALGLGTVLSLAVAGGLMALVFYSARHGYDDRVDDATKEE